MKIRFAKEEDIPLILRFIKDLADYEALGHEVKATEEILLDSLFRKESAEVIIGEYNGEPIGFALFFHNFSTFIGKAGLYLEDLYITPQMRGRGYGTQMLRFLANLAIERDCERFEWWCLDWNEPSIQFYKKIGAIPMDDWTVFRITKDKLNKF